jgi:hypothetical protein
MKNETNLNVERFNGVDVLKIMEMIKKQNTNFDRITASPEVLAEILTDIQTDKHFGVDCMTYEERLEWLKQECKK